ncbi:MAG: hypothetical protein AAF488_04505 [Planctomycetota bacterium]
MTTGIHLEPVSLGKGFIDWQVVYPSMAKKVPGLQKSYDDVAEACSALKRHLREDQVDDETRKLIEQHASGDSWGSDA